MSIEFVIIIILVFASLRDIYRTGNRIYMQFVLSKPKAYLVSALIFTLIMVSLTPIVLAIILLAARMNKIVPQWLADIGLLLLFVVVIYMLHRKDAESVAVKIVTNTLRIPQRNSE